jgi:hypothetical protein
MDQMHLTQALAVEQQRDRARAGTRSWQIAVARCCQPSRWARGARRLAAAALALRGQPRASDVACCA